MEIYGQNATGDSGAFVDAWNANLVETWPTTAVAIGISSADNTKDTGAGTGANTVGIWYIDANYAKQYGTVTLTGQTMATGVGSALWIEDAKVLTTGGEEDNAGIIWLYDAADTVTAGVPQTAAKKMGYIAAGENVMHRGSFLVPAGKTYRLLKLAVYQRDASATLRYGQVRLQFKPYGGVWQTINLPSFTSNSPCVLDYTNQKDSAPTFSAKTQVRVQSKQLAATPWGCTMLIEEW